MKTLNSAALVTFLIAKLLGIVGVSFGFVHRTYGGICLSGAIILLLCSITLSGIQLSRDREEGELENEDDNRILMLRRKKQELQWQIEELENQKLKLSSPLTSLK